MILIFAAEAARPTEGGSYAFSDEDEIATLDSAGGGVRVWYSASGPNVVEDDDDDGDGVPDFAASVASYAEDVLTVYEGVGFRAPISDEGEGGNDAMDVYLVDFGGNADGAYVAERCNGSQCSGYFVMENDFRGYGYGDLDEAIRVLTSHELFHAVQAAYDAEEEVWFSEGTAVWAEELYDPLTDDFLAFCDAYLEDTGRSIDEPPAGPVPTFAYATALWWWYLGDRYGDAFLVALLEATETSDEILVDMMTLQEDAGGSLEEDFSTFARWNLATGSRSGAAESYPFAADIGPVRAEADGSFISDDNRFYPLAATYYELEHAGGEIWFGAEEAAPDLRFSLHGEDDGAVGDALVEFDAIGAAERLGEFEEGDYWLVVSNPTLAEDSTKVLVCLGALADVEACVPEVATPDVPEGCGCGTGGGGGWVAMLFALAVAGRQRQARL